MLFAGVVQFFLVMVFLIDLSHLVRTVHIINTSYTFEYVRILA